jgi:nondiscriminating aspartyl-tRNA synthetase
MSLSLSETALSSDPSDLPNQLEPSDLLESVGQIVEAEGQIINVKKFGWGGFVILQTARGVLQVVVSPSESLDALPKGAFVRIMGEVSEKRVKKNQPRAIELQFQSVEILSVPNLDSELDPEIDLSKPALKLEQSSLLDNQVHTLRHRARRAIFIVQSEIKRSFAEFLSSQGFVDISTPKIGAGNAEGGANVFGLDYYGQAAFLAQSPQFYKQFLATAFRRVYEVGPVFRAEKSKTSRHLSTYTSMDLEMSFIRGFEDVMQMEAAMLAHVVASVDRNCSDQLETLRASGLAQDELPDLTGGIPQITFADAKQLILEKYGKASADDNDLEPDDELKISQAVLEETGSEFVFVTEYPWKKRPFYTMRKPEDPQVTRSFDLLFRGLEITTGGQREHRLVEQTEAMNDKGIDPESFTDFLALHRRGAPPHGGLGMGMERLTMQLLGISNVKQATLFPRDTSRLTP